jgi:hypothetical protein
MKKLLAMGLVTVLMFSSCALIFKGDSARIVFTSSPSQAQVLIDGSVIGSTTTEAVLKVNRSYNITFRKVGYADQTYILNNRIGALWIVLDVVSGLVPLVIDAATGAWYEFDTNNVNVTLTPQTLTEKPLPSWAKLALKRANLEIEKR